MTTLLPCDSRFLFARTSKPTAELLDRRGSDLRDDDPSQLLVAAAAAKKAAEPKAVAPSLAKPASKQPAKTPPPAEDARGSRGDVAGRGFGRTGRRRDHGDADANDFEGGYCLCNYIYGNAKNI
ncbi:hypothetical protein ZWY2020_001756 [Hordeum vulgare]|nr:hypothetical protein ZWY2020_001756 [Hordeum vulgare]